MVTTVTISRLAKLQEFHPEFQFATARPKRWQSTSSQSLTEMNISNRNWETPRWHDVSLWVAEAFHVWSLSPIDLCCSIGPLACSVFSPSPISRSSQSLVKSLTDQVRWPIALHSIGLVRTDSGHAPAVSRRFTSFHAQGCLMSVVSMLFPCRFFVFGVSDVFEISQGCVKHHDSMSWCTNTKTKGVERERHDFITKINGIDTVYHMCIYIYIYIRMYMRYSTHTCIDVVHTSVYQTKGWKTLEILFPALQRPTKIGSLKSHCRNHNQGEPEKNRLLYSTKRVCSSRTSSFRPWKQHVKQWEGQNIRRLQKTYRTMFKRPMTYKWEISIKQIWGAWHWVDSCCKTLQYSLR